MTDALLAGDLPLPPRPDYLRHGTTVTSWLTTTDHKRIAILYAITITIFFFILIGREYGPQKDEGIAFMLGEHLFIEARHLLAPFRFQPLLRAGFEHGGCAGRRREHC